VDLSTDEMKGTAMPLYHCHRATASLPTILVLAVVVTATTAVRSAPANDVEAKLLARAESNVEQCRKAEAVIHFKDAQGRPIANAPVRLQHTKHDFLFGCIAFDLVWGRESHQPALWKQRFSELFNFAVFPFYWARYEPQRETTMRERTVAAVQWCRANGITTKGHPLVWTNRSGLPKWLDGLSPEESEALMLNRVKREVAGCAGLIDIWDVVNEPIHCRAWKNVEARAYIKEPIDVVADYVDKAFRAAREANPNAHLILNEYYTIARTEDRQRFYDLVVELKRRGTPISGLGIQAHEPRQEWFPPQEVWATLEHFAELGFPLHITEYIPQSGGKDITGGWRNGKWTEETQAEYAEQFFRLCFGHPAVASINWWGFTDRRIWLPGGGLLNEECEPKPVYNRLYDLIHRQWTTRIDSRTDRNGAVKFRGFLGSYEIAVEADDGRRRKYQAVLQARQTNNWTFTLN
jgi:GH35 family endo-1,4-beta-xylanase